MKMCKLKLNYDYQVLYCQYDLKFRGMMKKIFFGLGHKFYWILRFRDVMNKIHKRQVALFHHVKSSIQIIQVCLFSYYKWRILKTFFLVFFLFRIIYETVKNSQITFILSFVTLFSYISFSVYVSINKIRRFFWVKFDIEHIIFHFWRFHWM